MTESLLQFRPIFPLLSLPLLSLNRSVEWSFRSGLRKVERLPIPVVSVGNLTSGGTGKSPVVRWIAERLLDRGFQPAIALRGHGGSRTDHNVIVSDGKTVGASVSEVGDEAIEHAQRLPGVGVVAGRDRVQSGRIACEQLKSNVLILDDGFQYWRLHRDIEVVLIEATWLLGERTPRHFPREPLSALRRADILLLSKADSMTVEEKEEARAYLTELAPNAHIIGACRLEVEGVFDLLTGMRMTVLAGSMKTLAFCGIADNESFFALAQSQAMPVVRTVAFRDHHFYQKADFSRLNDLADESNADVFLTTDKDAVKLDPDLLMRPAFTLRVRAHVEPEDEIVFCLRKILESQASPGSEVRAAH